MSIATHPGAATTVLVVGPDAAVRSAIGRLLSLDPGIAVVGSAPALDEGSPPAEVVIDESLLHDFRHLSIADFIATVKSLGLTPAAAASRHLQPVPSAHDMRELLSDRELEVVRLVAEGLSNKEISLRLELSDKTVKNHISHILAKMQLTARTQVAVHALRAGLV
jgi:DNA-binding CsgD family transcriptional regulator